MGCMKMKLVPEVGEDCTLVGNEVSDSCSTNNLANRIIVDSIGESEFLVVFLFSFSFVHSHLFVILLPYLFSYERSDLGEFVHVGKWL